MRSLTLAPLSLLAAGCSGGVPIDVAVGPVGFDVDTARIAIPAMYQSSGSFARLACGASARCPSLGTGAPALRCASGVCDPDPFTFDLGVMNAIDLGAYSPQLAAVSGNVDSITVTQMSWQAAAAGLRVTVGPVDLFWGPESASGVGSDGVRHLGRLPVLQFPASGTASGDVALDADGNAALSEHLLRVSRRFRVFARAAVDLRPGGPLPAGRASIQVRMTVRAETRLLR